MEQLIRVLGEMRTVLTLSLPLDFLCNECFVCLFQLEKNKKPGLSLVINENAQQDPWDSSFR